jgi:hypothetical protein
MTTPQSPQDHQSTERVTHDSPRTVMPRSFSPWLLRFTMLFVIVAIVAIVFTVLRLGPGGSQPVVSDPAETPQEYHEDVAP